MTGKLKRKAASKGAFLNRTVLVTGSAGFIGSSLLPRLVPLASHVIAWDRSHDVRDKKTWKLAVKHADTLVLLAAQTSAVYANNHPLEDVSVNLLPVVHFIDECRRTGRRPDVIFAGTVTEVGLTADYPVDESFPELPRTVYDIDKLAAEKYLRYYALEMGGRSVTLRLGNVYGPGPLARRDRGVVNRMVRTALLGKPLTVFGKGNEVRDYNYINDVADAFVRAGQKIGPLSGHVYVLGSGKGFTISQMAGLIAEEVEASTGKKIAVKHVQPPKHSLSIESRSFVADSKAFSKATGWRSRTSLRDGIQSTIAYYSKNFKR